MDKNRLNFFRLLGRVLIFILVTALLLVLAVHLACSALLLGPSDTIRSVFTMSLKETSALKFVPNLYLSDEQVQEIENSTGEAVYEETDTSLITIAAPASSEEAQSGPVADAWGFVDEDGDGIIIDPIAGESFSGFMMIVLDPSRVVVACDPDSFWHSGYRVDEWIEKYDAVAGTNAGGFLDPNGQGNGSTPDSVVVNNGQVYMASYGCRQGFVGMDSNHILQVGNNFTEEELKSMGIMSGVCFGPVLVNNGKSTVDESTASGLNPRTALGQRSDGAILMLVIDGRQATSLGAKFQDEAEIMLRYGAVTACNLDGGSSTRMWFNGDYINDAASVKGIRPVPTAIVVLKQGVASDD